MTEPKDLTELFEKSSSTDVQVLLTVKEQLKREMLADPANPALSSAFERADRNLMAAMQKQAQKEKARQEDARSFEDVNAVLAYIKDQGRKLGRTKLFEDIRNGRLRRQSDGSFRLRHVTDYMASLPWAATPTTLADKAADRQSRKEEADIRRLLAAARREEFQLTVLQGKYIEKSLIHAELAVRAVALRDGLKNAAETRAQELIELVHGDPRYTAGLLEFMGRMFDECMGDYARPLTFEVTFADIPPDVPPEIPPGTPAGSPADLSEAQA